MNRLVSAVAAIVVCTPFGIAAETHAYRAARLWPGNGPVITDAVLVTKDGKIVAAGKRQDVTMPADAIVHDLGDSVLIPGLIVAETTLADKGRDDLHAMTPSYRAIDGFDPFADYSAALMGGVTTAQISPGGRRLLPGQGSVVKLAGEELARRTLRDEESMRIVLGGAFKNPPRVYEPPVGAVSVDRPVEPTRPQLAGGLTSAIGGLRATFQAARASKGSATTVDPFLLAIASSGTPNKPLRITAPTSGDVQAALGLAREFDLKLLLVDIAAPTHDQMTSWKGVVDGIVMNPGVRPGMMTEASGTDDSPASAATRQRRRQPTNIAPRPGVGRSNPREEDAAANSPAEAIRELRSAGFRVALKPVNDADLKDMLYVAGLFTTHNSAADVLKMVTSDAATMLGVANRIGTLTAGKDADFVVLTGDPFALHSRVKSVYVDGQQVHDAATANSQKVIRGARVWTGTGEVIPNGAVFIDGKTIRAVGRDVSTPADAEERRFAGAVVVPGMLDLGNGIGVGGPLTSTIAINTKLGARLVSGDAAAPGLRQAGITSVLLSAAAPSPVLAFKLGDKFRPIKDPVALKFAVKGNLTSAGATVRDSLKAGRDYADRWNKYDADFAAYEKKKKEFDATKPKDPEKKLDEKKDDAKAVEKKDEKKTDDKKPEEKKPEEPKPPTKPQVVESLDPFRGLFAGKIPALVEAKREDAIRLAVTIFRDEFNLRTMVIGADDAHRVVDLLAEKSVAVAAGPELMRSVDKTDVNLPMALAIRAVPFGFQSQSTGGAKHLPLAVGFAVRRGLGADDALRGLSTTPAQFLGLDSIGSIAVGKDADLVVLSGAPFELSTRVLAVMIDGQWVYREGD